MNVTSDGIHYSLVTCTNKCGWAMSVCLGWDKKKTNENKVMLSLDDLIKYAHVKNECKCLNKNDYMWDFEFLSL